MASQKMREKRTEYTKEGIREAQMSVTGGSKTNLLTCGKCKKRDVTYNQVSTGFVVEFSFNCWKTARVSSVLSER